MNLTNEWQALKKHGARIIGCFPLYPPLELIHSLGLTPVVLWDFPGPAKVLEKADRHLQRFACSVGRQLTEFILSRESEILDGLFMYNACDTLRNLPEIVASGLAEQKRSLPLVRTHIPMAPPEQTAWEDYFRKKIWALIRNLEETFGVTYSLERFQRSVELYQQMRSLATTLMTRTAGGIISYRLFSRTLQEANFRTVEEQITLLEKILRENPTGRAQLNEPDLPIVLSGILPPSPAVIRVMENVGLRVVGNDIASQERAYGYTPAQKISDPCEYYLDFYQNHVPCPTLLYLADQRLERIKNLVQKTEAAGVVFLGEKFCEYEYFEIPFLEKILKKKGVAVTSLEISAEDGDQAAIVTRIEPFADMLREKAQKRGKQN
ncbi:MAG: 2-hydroxyacyl-CoA dehydratase [Deltaproteobacteria bacterium]|nr:2-hydroxyacyl-CoA dehydratase [Deltaproteobacteria bacterium]